MVQGVLYHALDVVEGELLLLLVHQREVSDILVHGLLQPEDDPLNQVVAVGALHLGLAVLLNLSEVLITDDLVFELDCEAIILPLGRDGVHVIVNVVGA